MSVSFKKLFFYSGLLSTTVLGQDYSATISDLNASYDPPANIQYTICTHIQESKEREACVNGVMAASWMAQKHAVKVGEYLGCVDGYFQGVNDGFLMTSNATSEQRAQAERLYSKLSFESAKSRAEQKASVEGETASASQLIARYRLVINQKDSQGRQVLPDKTMKLPVITFRGFDDGYENDVLSKMPNTDLSDMVGASASAEDKFVAQKFKLKQSQVSRQLCDPNVTAFLSKGRFPNLTLWDYFRAKREQNFEQYGWSDAG